MKVSENDYGDLIVSYLQRLGVEYVFGVPGGAIEPLYNALARSERQGGPRAITARHETGAAFMAEGYARETGKLGVCCATSGPGATNLLTGIASAYADSTSVLAITGQPSIKNFGMGALQEGSCTGINTVSLFDHCTNFNTLVSHSVQLERKLVMAISHALGNDPGPVHLSVPVDLMRAPVTRLEQNGSLRAFINYETVPTEGALQLLIKELSSRERVTLLVGEGCLGAAEEIVALAEGKNWLMAATPRAKGLIPEFHPLYRGVFGFAGHMSAREAMLSQNAERILAIGTGLDEVSTGGWDNSTGLFDRLIHVSNNPRHLSRSTSALVCILGSPRLLMKPLKEALLKNETKPASTPSPLSMCLPGNAELDNATRCVDVRSNIKPQSLFWHLSQTLSPDVRIYADAGSSYLWGIHYWWVRQSLPSGRTPFQIGIGFSSMGWAIGAAVGAAAGAKGAPVICVTGDGSALMSGQEITTAMQENLNVLFIILNDSCLGMVKHGQRIANAERVGTDLPRINFALMAESMGVESYAVNTFADLECVNVQSMISQPGPCLLVVRIDCNEVPPLGNRMRVLTEESSETVHV